MVGAIKNRDRAMTFPDGRSQLYLKSSKLWWAGLQTQHSPPELPLHSLPLLEEDGVSQSSVAAEIAPV